MQSKANISPEFDRYCVIRLPVFLIALQLLILLLAGPLFARQTQAETLSLPRAPQFSHPAGFYTQPFDLQISASDPGHIVLYTLDGSVPDAANTLTAMPVLVADRTPEANRLVNIMTTPNTQFDRYRWYEPAVNVDKAVIVRARTLAPDGRLSDVVTNTYFVNAGSSSNPDEGRDYESNGVMSAPIGNLYTLPVFSLVTDEGNFFDPDSGIYHLGSRNNYYQRGEEWERAVHVEYFNRGGHRLLAQDAGMRIHGGWSRNAAQKTLRLYARSMYGVNRFFVPFFETFTGSGITGGTDYGSVGISSAYATSGTVTASAAPAAVAAGYNRILLRNSGNDFGFTMIRDAMAQMLIKHMNVDVQLAEPALVFFNGEYWGIHNIRERYDRHYLERVHRVDGDRIDLLTYIHQIGEVEVKEGSDEAYQIMKEYALSNNLSIDQHYAYVADRMDIDNFIDYYITQIYYGNHDWPQNNIDFWRYQTEPAGGPHHPADGRFRWLMYDVDMSFGLGFGASITGHGNNTVGHALREHWSTALFRSLLENDGFRRTFLNRFILHMHTTFDPDRTLGYIRFFEELIEAEMPQHIGRWPNHVNMSTWRQDIGVMRGFALNRPAHILGNLRHHFETGPEQTLHLVLPDTEHGVLDVEGVGLGTDTGLPADILAAAASSDNLLELPFHTSVPVHFTARSHRGYRHSGWQVNGSFVPGDTLIVFPHEGKSIEPVFTTDHRVLLHYWHFNDPDNLMLPAVSTGDASLGTTYHPDAEIGWGSDPDFSGQNARGGETPGRQLQVSRATGLSLLFSLPTTGFSDPVLSFEAGRSGDGSGTLHIDYSTNGITFSPHESISLPPGLPLSYAIPFSGLTNAADNPNFRVRLRFDAGDGGTAGINAIDNLTLEAEPIASMASPPAVIDYPAVVRTAGSDLAAEIDLAEVFLIDEASAISIETELLGGSPISKTIYGTVLTLEAEDAGESLLRISLSTTGSPDDPSQASSILTRVLSHPAAWPLSGGPFRFDDWDPDHPAGTFPPHILFAQSDLSDPGLDSPMPYAYHIPDNDYHPDDFHLTGFPYALTRRTRISGLGDEGAGFINTGRDRDVGALILSLDTRGIDEADLHFTASTRIRNSRHYAIRVRYRTSIDDPFSDLLIDGQPVEYLRGFESGHTSAFTGIPLPDELTGEPFVQLKWKYYHTGGRDTHESGARDKLSIGNILVEARVASSFPGDDNNGIPARTGLMPAYPNPFNAEATIRYELASAGDVRIEVFDITGRRVATLVDGNQNAGVHTTRFRAHTLASGVYLVRLRSGGTADVSRIMLLK